MASSRYAWLELLCPSSGFTVFVAHPYPRIPPLLKPSSRYLNPAPSNPFSRYVEYGSSQEGYAICTGPPSELFQAVKSAVIVPFLTPFRVAGGEKWVDFS